MSLGVCLGGDLPEQQHQHGHHRRGYPYGACPQVPGEHHRCQGGGKNVDHVVANQNGSQGSVKMIRNLQCPGSPFIALGGVIFQPDLVDSGKCGFTAGKKCGHGNQKHDDNDLCHLYLLFFSVFAVLHSGSVETCGYDYNIIPLENNQGEPPAKGAQSGFRSGFQRFA